MSPLPPGLAALVDGYKAEASGGGESGCAVYRLTCPGRAPLFLKHGVGRAADDVVDEAVRLRWLGRHFPSARLRFLAAVDDAAWLLSEAVIGTSGDALIERGGADIAMIAREAGRLLRLLHDLPVDDCPFDAGHALRLRAARRNIDLGLVDEDDFDAEHEGWSAEQVWTKLNELARPAHGSVVTHGDYSLGNILFADGRATGVIDVGRLGRADPYQDLAIMWSNLEEHGADAQGQFLRAYGIDEADADRIAFHLCLDELF